MTFRWPEALVLLIIVPILAGLYIWMQRRRQSYALRYASVALVREAVGAGPGVKRHIPAVIYLLAVTAMIIALSRPEAKLPVPQNTGTVILSIDVSGSMLAEDVAPNRIEATKKAVRDFVNKQPSGVKIGVVSFSDFAALVAPPSLDRKPVLDAINRLRAERGTNIGSGLQIALDALQEQSDAGKPTALGEPTPTPTPGTKIEAATIVLLSDGQSNTGPSPLDVAQEAVNAGIKVYTIGIGTPEGTILEIQGRAVFTKLDEDTLKSIAQQTGASYFSAQDESQLHNIYDDLSRQRQIQHKQTEITFAFAGVAMVFSLIAGALGLVWFNRLP